MINKSQKPKKKPDHRRPARRKRASLVLSRQVVNERIVAIEQFSPNGDLTLCPGRASLDSSILWGDGLSSTSELLDQLPSLSRSNLLQLWQKNFGRPASPGLRRELMLPILAFRIQELAHGGLKPETKAKLREFTPSLGSTGRNDTRPRFKAGTRLVREWRGKVHEVVITADGFEYLGETYKSLSPIACRITGTHWSGPAFFGTKRAKQAQ